MFAHLPRSSGIPDLLERLARVSTRPRYAFMLLGLIAEVADGRGQAGPFVRRGTETLTLRDWLCEALIPTGGRDPRRLAVAGQVRAELAREGTLPGDPAAADRAVDVAVRERVRASAKSNISRAVSELVAAGLLRRHYCGWRVDHVNRGAQRHAAYTLAGPARCLVAAPPPVAPAAPPRQMALF